MTTVYCAYEAVIDGDGYLHWKHLFVASTVAKAQEIINYKHFVKGHQGIISSLTEANYYTYVGDRVVITKAVNEVWDTKFMSMHGKGFVIEAQSVL
jgi:hypothetical protein